MPSAVPVQPTVSRQDYTRWRDGRWYGLMVGVFAVATLICGWLVRVPGYDADVNGYKDWARLTTNGGVEAAYSGTFPETYASYPPVLLYAYKVVGHAYQRLVDPSMDRAAMHASLAATVAIKSVAAGFHLVLAAAIFLLLVRSANPRSATLATSAYVLNPAALWDSAYWGQPDAAHALWLVVAFGLVATYWWRWGWASAALAAMTKPQAWFLLPAFAYGEFVVGGPRRVAIGAGVASAVVLIVLMPFIVSGRIGDFLGFIGQIVRPTTSGIASGFVGMPPAASAFAHNLWWLVSGGSAQVSEDLIPDGTPLIGPLSYRQVALALFAVFALLVLCWVPRARGGTVFLLAAYQAFGWFCLTTGAHENHIFFVLPLLAMALPGSKVARLLLCAVTVTSFMNFALHDPSSLAKVQMLGDARQEDILAVAAARLGPLGPVLLRTALTNPVATHLTQALASPSVLQNLRLSNAAANLVILVGWTIWLPRALAKHAPPSGDRVVFGALSPPLLRAWVSKRFG